MGCRIGEVFVNNNNNNNNPLCKAPECQKTSVALSSRIVIYLFQRDTPVYRIMKWIEEIGRSERDSWVSVKYW